MPDVACLEPLDDRSQLRLRLLERQRVVRHVSSLLDTRGEAALGELDVHAVAGREGGRRAHDLVSLADDGVAAGEGRARRERTQPSRALLERRAAALQQQAAAAAQAVGLSLQPFPAAGRGRPAIRAGALAAPLERRHELGEVRHDEAGGSRRRGCADVGGEIAERRVLLVSDRGHDGHGTGDDGAHEPLVAERQQVLEAPAAAGEHDHVDGGLRGDRLRELRRSPLPRTAPGRVSRRPAAAPGGSGS